VNVVIVQFCARMIMLSTERHTRCYTLSLSLDTDTCSWTLIVIPCDRQDGSRVAYGTHGSRVREVVLNIESERTRQRRLWLASWLPGAEERRIFGIRSVCRGRCNGALKSGCWQWLIRSGG
jgi:hypothetical protein